MSVIAFNFTKIAAERKGGQANAKLNIQNQTRLLEVKESPVGSQKALLFTFEHASKYEPNFGSIVITGEVLILSNEKEVKDTLASYAKTKQFGAELTQKVFNTILNRASVEALVLAKDLNLPAPFKLPRIEVKPAAAKTAVPVKKK